MKAVEALYFGNMRGVKRALAARAAVDGIPGDVYVPLVLAARCGRLGVVNLLLKEGANIETATYYDPLPAENNLVFPRGTRALHAASYTGEVGVLHALLQAGAQPNVKDCQGVTPLMAACNGQSSVPRCSATMVEVLLEAGAPPSLADNAGRVALHHAAHWGADDVIQVLAAAAPSTLNHADDRGETPLAVAAESDHESTVRLLLSIGASDRETWMKNRVSSLEVAAHFGQEGVTAVLLDVGLEAVGGVQAVPVAMNRAIKCDHPRILDKLLGVEGEEMRAWWANSSLVEDLTVLMYAATGCRLAATSVLLAAGADERGCSNSGVPATNAIIGGALDDDERDEAREAALGRMLERGPAFRARSYCWPLQANAAVEATASGLAPSGGKATTPSVPLGVGIFRRSNSTFFTSRIARYTQKCLGMRWEG